LNCKVREDQVSWDDGNFGLVFANYDRPHVAESGGQKLLKSDRKNGRFAPAVSTGQCNT
jgi:hypothetical protein